MNHNVAQAIASVAIAITCCVAMYVSGSDASLFGLFFLLLVW